MDYTYTKSKNYFMIIFSNPKKLYDNHKKEIDQVIKSTLNSGSYINSLQVANFEKNFAKYIDIKHSVGVGNATDAIFISLLALGIEKKDEVITVSHTAAGTVIPISKVGAKPIFVDIDLKNYNIDLDLLEKKISLKTKAIIAVHLYGQSVDMNRLKKISIKYKIPIIEDCSQAAGALHNNQKLGSFGNVSCFSFFPTKNLSGYGDGGMICTNNKLLFKKIKIIREYGWDKNRNLVTLGTNSRLDEIQAAILNVKLKYLDKNNNERINIAKKYSKHITNKKITLPVVSKNNKHVFHLYVIRLKLRNKLIQELNKHKIFPGIHYKKPIHRQKFYSKYNKYSLPNTVIASNEVLSLPIYPGLKSFEQNKIIKIINNF